MMLDNIVLPARYQAKLHYDLEQIRKSEIVGLQSIILFGSCARNKIRVGSDIDLLILVREPVARMLCAELRSDLAEEKNGISTDVVFYTIEDFAKSDCQLVKEIKKDGLTLWEG